MLYVKGEKSLGAKRRVKIIVLPCGGKNTRQTISLCRVLTSRHTAKTISLPCVFLGTRQSHNFYSSFRPQIFFTLHIQHVVLLTKI